MNDEFSLIRSLLQHRVSGREKGVEVDAGDDAAVLNRLQGSTVLTCDTMVETVHFLPETMEPWDIGWKCMTANISDVAAMGGRPTHALVSLAVPEGWSREELGPIYRGMEDASAPFDLRIVGGDTVSSPQHLVLTVVLLGEVEEGQALLRSSARPGDIVFVTGETGSSAAGLHLLKNRGFNSAAQRYPTLVKAHRQPVPRVDAGRWLLHSGWKPACNDVSDGLAREAWEIAEASGIRILLEREKVPLGEETVAYAREIGADPYYWALEGGEDFELLGTAPREAFLRGVREAEKKGIRLIEIGRVEEGPAGVDCKVNGQRREWTGRGYNHFADR
ncbi:thiamine-phosphate kinase [Paludifilum halophilum]|uniref:thiamine-phosphate kinase n=1 Tax=Paludifilum halophilum TaxID=1642702 RepID=UPI001469E05A|nr:thiamine-phosphate kinase [Paludifilum halophilum]